MKGKITWLNGKKKVSDLKPFPGNPRKADEKQASELRSSLDRFNLADPLIINTDGTVIGGNFRLRLLTEKKIDSVDVRIPNRTLTKEEADELNLRLNKNKGDWDIGELAKFSEEMLKDVGWANDELDEIFGLDKVENFNVAEELKKVVKNPKGVKVGDLWQLGNHRLIIGNSTDRKNWERLMGEERFDFMFTDPPYKIAYGKNRLRKVKTKDGYKLKGRRKYESVGDTDGKGKALKGFGYKGNRIYEGVEMTGGVPEYDAWLSIANEFQNPKGANVMIFEYWKNMVELWQAISKYWKIRNMIIWHLPNRHQGFAPRNQFFGKYDIAPLAGDGPVNEKYEIEFDKYLQEKGQKLIDTYDILMFGTHGKAEWSKKKGGKMWTMSDHVTWTASSETESGQNVVFGVKPVPILIPYIKTLSPRGGLVMEPFGGSGSCIIASEIMKRKCYAIELSETYAEVILNRFEKFSGIKAVKLENKA